VCDLPNPPPQSILAVVKVASAGFGAARVDQHAGGLSEDGLGDEPRIE